MNLKTLAESDLATTLEDVDNGFGVAIKLTSLASVVYNVAGQFNRIGVDIDPETGLLVAGQKSTITIRLSSLGGTIPEDGWIIETTDITGTAVKGKAGNTMLDRSLGIATMFVRR